MNKEALKQEIAKRLDTLSKEETVSLIYFLVVSYSMLTTLLQNLGNMLNHYAEGFGKTVQEDNETINKFLSNLSGEKAEEISKE